MHNFTLLVKVLNLYWILILLSACQSTSVQLSSSESILFDQGFVGFSDLKLESEQDVFYLDEDAIAFVSSTIEPVKNKTDQMETLVKAIFDRSKLNLLYQGDANTTANDTFHSRAANCLSMSIMTYALATEAGFEVDFQEIMIPEYWTRRSGYSLLNGHINLKLLAPHEPNVFLFNERSYLVDFDPQSARRGLPKKIVSKQAILSMFYNNKGGQALVDKEYDLAYQYFKAEYIRGTQEFAVFYNSIELPVGLRHYFFLNENSKFFINSSTGVNSSHACTQSTSM